MQNPPLETSRTDLDSHISKRSACHLMNDIIQSSNLIDHRSNSNSAQPSELILDNQPSRINNENRAPAQNLSKSLSKRITESILIDRITLSSRVSRLINLDLNQSHRTIFKGRYSAMSSSAPPLPPGPPPIPAIPVRTRIREIDAFEYKAAIETKGLETVPKLTSKNYRDWKSRISYFLKSRKIYDVCTIEQEDPPIAIVETMNQVAMQHLSSSVDDTIYNSIFADPTDLTPFKVWSLLKDKFGGRNIYNMRDVFKQWDMCYLNSSLSDYVDRVERVLGEFKSIGIDITHAFVACGIISRVTRARRALMDSLVVDEALISDPYRLLNKLRQLSKHDAATARSLGSKASGSNSNSSTALASNTDYKNKRSKRSAPTANVDYNCNGGKHDNKAPHPPEKCWTLHPEQREEYLAKKRAKALQAANVTSTQDINNINTDKSPSPPDADHAAPSFYCCTTALSSVAINNNTSTVLDSGASTHMFNSLEYFTSTHPVHIYIITGDGKTREELVAVKKGTVSFKINNNKVITLKDALYVPNLSKNLISFSQLVTDEILVRRNGRYYEVIVNKNEKLFTIDTSNQLFELAGNITPTYPKVASLLTESSAITGFNKWHNRLGHASTD
ncbi:hypothetical protein PSHT_10654 [Puccinia striiformis]|uniref:Retrovirus-related Pol polyprotein from transposon TNT 1-94-like beta-barrel domain-containing protein n=1 Tax=Puccinia striiformis TaxID=27350 RepID=A0A2S4V8F5_9BASI|nr:hypothetical protein PSHT_10654 [Puccinia striiformis]